MEISINNIIGKKIVYLDYLGCERYGKIIHIEPYPLQDNLVYVYIQDDEYSENTHTIITQNGEEMYAELRLSNEVYFDNVQKGG
jgi:hypothetical protein